MAIWAKVAHPAPWHLSTRYPVTPTLSVEAVQVRLICAPLAAVATRFVGAVGACVSGGPAAAARNATICITHVPLFSGAVAR